MEFNLQFPRESLKAALLTSLLSVWLLVALYAFLNHYSKRRYFTIWTAGWLFYALYLTLSFVEMSAMPGRVVLMSRQWALSLSAVFLLWGGFVFLAHRVGHRLLGLFMLFLLVWSYLGVYYSTTPLMFELPVFVMMGVFSLLVARCFFKHRLKESYLGASMLSVGFGLWGLYLAGFPFLERDPELAATAFFLSAVLQLFIAVSMIILVLEESRATMRRVLASRKSAHSAQVGLQAQIQSTEHRYRKLFEQASDAIVITDAERLDILECNTRACQLLGLAADSRPEGRLTDYLKGEDNRPVLGQGQDAYDRIRERRAWHLTGRDGRLTPIEVEGTMVDMSGRPACQFILREMTERARLEQQLRQSEKLSAIGQMISGIAHELNNPLAVIQGYLQIILSHHALPNQTRSDLEKVAQESNRASKLVRSFLTFARAQSQRRSVVNLNELVARVVDLRSGDLRACGVEVLWDLSPDQPRAQADPDQITQVLVNLLGNALHVLASRPLPRKIRFRTEQLAAMTRLRVEDNGPGVPQELQARIFEPFFTTKGVGTGTGLGLSIAHSIMSEHKGRIQCETSPLGGAGFLLEFPAPAEGDAAEPAEIPDEEPPAPVSPPARILVLDDEEALAEMLGEMLTLLGHTVTVCSRPGDALKKADTEDYDVIFSDFRMPEMNGKDFYDELAKRKPALSPRVIFLTGDVVTPETRSFFESIGNQFINKPFHIDGVKTALAEALERNSKRTAA